MRDKFGSAASRRIHPLLALDLFAGCGGLTTGLKRAGFKVVGAVELDPLAAQTFRKNHPEVRVWQKDIRRQSCGDVSRKLRLRKGRLDLLAGCPPCQAFSRMRSLNRSRRVRDPKQKDLLREFLRFVRGLKPKAVMIENVPGLSRDRRWKELVAVLRRAGYKCQFRTLNAADYGVPQRRRRLILLGSRRNVISFAKSDGKRVYVRQAISSLRTVGRSGDRLHDFPENRSPVVLSLIRSIPKNGGSRTDLPKDAQLSCHRRCDGFKDVYGRMKWDAVAPTITSGCVNPSKGRFLHPTANRAITLREAALLQSFPMHYFFDLSAGKYAVAAMIGNALPPEFVRRHASQVRRALRQGANPRG